MRKLILELTRSPVVRKTATALGLHSAVNWWLGHFPVVKTLRGSGIRYRARRIESLALSVEMFDECVLYAASGLPLHIRSFADLGCNVGYFTCWLCHHAKNRQLKGLMVDANVEAIEEARWHVKINGFQNVRVLCGVVGAGIQQPEVDFFLHRSNVCSSAVPPDGAKGLSVVWKRVKVPQVCVEENWRKYFGDEPCDVLKVDIEGSEMDFFRAELAFLRRVHTILLEWHKWRVTTDEVKTFLTSNGFSLKAVLHEGPDLGTGIFVRTDAPR